MRLNCARRQIASNGIRLESPGRHTRTLKLIRHSESRRESLSTQFHFDEIAIELTTESSAERRKKCDESIFFDHKHNFTVEKRFDEVRLREAT